MQYLHPRGELAAHPGLGTVPSEHTDMGAHTARRPSKSIQPVCWQQRWIQAGNVKMFGLSLHSITGVCQPSSDFIRDVLGWRNYDFLVEQEVVGFFVVSLQVSLHYTCFHKEAKEHSTKQVNLYLFNIRVSGYLQSHLLKREHFPGATSISSFCCSQDWDPWFIQPLFAHNFLHL